MIHSFTRFAIAGAVLGAIATPAFAGGTCDRCFRREVTPPVYGVVHRDVMVRAPRAVAHVVPAQYGVVHQTVQVAPARVVATRTPDRVATVHQTVQVAPARRVMTRSFDHHGREVVCERTLAAQYGTVARHVVVPGQVQHHVVPAQYATVARTVQTAPARVVHSVIPGEVHRVPQRVLVHPGSDRWVPVSPRRHH